MESYRIRGPRPFRLFLMVILALTPLVQSFWFGRAWRVIDAVAWPGPRTLLQGLWIVAALVVLAVVLDMLRVRVLPLRVFGPWGRAVVQLWLIASCLSFLAMMVVESFAWFSRPAMAALPVAQWARVRPARHTVFRYVVWRAGGLPFLAAVYGATVGRLRYRVITIEVPSTDLPPHLDGLRIVHLSDIHIGAFMPRALFLCAPRIVDTHAPLPQDITEGAITTEQASSVPLQSFSVFFIVHI